MSIWVNRTLRQSATPFPRVVVDDFLPDSIVEPLVRDCSDGHFFHHRGWGGSRVSVQYGSHQWEQLQAMNETVRQLHELLVSQKTLEELFELFGPHLSDSGLKEQYRSPSQLHYTPDRTEFVITSSVVKRAYIKSFYNPILRRLRLRRHVRALARRVNGPTVHPLLSISVSKGGYLQPVHTDARHKIFVGLVYLDDIVDGGELQILQAKTPTRRDASMQFPELSALNTVASIAPKRNRLVAFVNTNDAYHATTAFQGLRRFIYFSYAASHEESAFETSYPVSLGDADRGEL